jgi:hypothetical protein
VFLARAWQILKWFLEKPPAAGQEETRAARPRQSPPNLSFLKIKACVVQRRFEAARAILRELACDPEPDKDATDTAARLCESVADDLREWDRDGSIWLYEQSLFYFQEFAAWASSGGEGSARMGSVNRVEGKLRQMRAADPI